MAGKVLNSFTKGFAGTVSRAVDDVIESFVNNDTKAIEFGAPVVLDGNGVKNFVAASSTADDFVGIAVRVAKTNETYGLDDAAWQSKEICEILKRGTVSIKVKSGVTAPVLGGKVYIDKTTGEFTTATTGTALPNCKFKGGVDANNIAEVAVLTRAL